MKLQLLRFTYESIKPIEKLSRRHLIISFDVSNSLLRNRILRDFLCIAGRVQIGLLIVFENDRF